MSWRVEEVVRVRVCPPIMKVLVHSPSEFWGVGPDGQLVVVRHAEGRTSVTVHELRGQCQQILDAHRSRRDGSVFLVTVDGLCRLQRRGPGDFRVSSILHWDDSIYPRNVYGRYGRDDDFWLLLVDDDEGRGRAYCVGSGGTVLGEWHHLVGPDGLTPLDLFPIGESSAVVVAEDIEGTGTVYSFGLDLSGAVSTPSPTSLSYLSSMYMGSESLLVQGDTCRQVESDGREVATLAVTLTEGGSVALELEAVPFERGSELVQVAAVEYLGGEPAVLFRGSPRVRIGGQTLSLERYVSSWVPYDMTYDETSGVGVIVTGDGDAGYELVLLVEE